jgi:hypothetical protein
MPATWPWQSKPIEEAAIELNDRDPEKFPLGIFSQDDIAGGFMWFSSLEEMSAAAVSVLSFVNVAEDDLEGMEAHRKATAALLPQGLPAKLDESLRDAINDAWEALDSGAGGQLIWWGNFEDLLSGGGEFECELRANFREDEDGSSIQPGEKADFLGFIKDDGA